MPEFSRKAIITADMAIAMMVFVVMVSVAFYYVSYLSNPKQPFDATLKVQSFQITEKLRNNVSWTVYRSPIIINSEYAGARDFEMQFQPETGTDINSIAILDAGMTEIPSSFSNNIITWVANASAGKNVFYLTYLKNTALSAPDYSTDLTEE